MALDSGLINYLDNYASMAETMQIDDETDSLSYVGFARNRGAADDDAVWKLYRLVKNVNVTRVTEAAGEFTNKWDDRATSF